MMLSIVKFVCLYWHRACCQKYLKFKTLTSVEQTREDSKVAMDITSGVLRALKYQFAVTKTLFSTPKPKWNTNIMSEEVARIVTLRRPFARGNEVTLKAGW